MGDLSAGVEHWLARADHRPSGLAYIGKERPKVLILGSGAGREVLEALYFGASSITAVEMNPIITDIVAHRMRESLGGLFQQPGVRLVTEEARSFVRRSEETYDAIISVQTNSNTALASGALGLAEGYMFTREALEDYLDHLSADGVLLITRSPNEVARLFATVREVFERRGLGSPARHLVAVQTPPVVWGPRHASLGFCSRSLLGHRTKFACSGSGSRRIVQRLPRVGAPRSRSSTRLSRRAREASTIRSWRLRTCASFYADQPFDVSPATDDRPFFNQQARWSQVSLASLVSTNDLTTRELNSGATNHPARPHGDDARGAAGASDPVRRGSHSVALGPPLSSESARGRSLVVSDLFRRIGAGLHHDRDCLAQALYPLSWRAGLRTRRGAGQPPHLHWRGRLCGTVLGAAQRAGGSSGSCSPYWPRWP